MAYDLSSIMIGAEPRKPIIVIHGEPGVGKTTFAAGAEKVIFIRAEDGIASMRVPTFPLVKTFSDIMEAMATLCTEEHGFKTLVVDSLSSMESIIWSDVCAENNVDNIEEIGYGKGYVFALRQWKKFLKACEHLSREGMTIVLIAHTKINRIDPPTGAAYSRYEVRLHDKAREIIEQTSDIIGFAHQPVTVSIGNNEKTGKGKGIKPRELMLIGGPSASAKGRDNMPTSIELDWNEFAPLIENYGEKENG